MNRWVEIAQLCFRRLALDKKVPNSKSTMLLRANAGQNGLGKVPRQPENLKRRIYEIYPHLEMPAALVESRRLSSRERAEVQKAHDKVLACPRDGVSRKRLDIETARFIDDMLKPHEPVKPPRSPLRLSKSNFFKIRKRNRPLHEPDERRHLDKEMTQDSVKRPW